MDVRNKISIILACFVLGVTLTQCEQHYRYPCQNPENWKEDYCQRPLCEVNRDCPEYVFKEGAEKLGITPVEPIVKPCDKGCK